MLLGYTVMTMIDFKNICSNLLQYLGLNQRWSCNMAKSASAIRLQAELMKVAGSTAKRFHRSTAEQIGYWADLGRSVSSIIEPDVLLSVSLGLTVLKTEPVMSAPVNPDDVFKIA